MREPPALVVSTLPRKPGRNAAAAPRFRIVILIARERPDVVNLHAVWQGGIDRQNAAHHLAHRCRPVEGTGVHFHCAAVGGELSDDDHLVCAIAAGLNFSHDEHVPVEFRSPGNRRRAGIALPCSDEILGALREERPRGQQEK